MSNLGCTQDAAYDDGRQEHTLSPNCKNLLIGCPCNLEQPRQD